MKLHKFLPAALIVALVATANAAPRKNRTLLKRFDTADLNHDDQLTHTEFLGLQGRRVSWATALYRFNLADGDHDGFVSELEFLVSNGGYSRKRATRVQVFMLADQDNDGFLDPEEYSLTQAPTQTWGRLMRSFSRADRDDDALLSPREFGIRGVLPL